MLKNSWRPTFREWIRQKKLAYKDGTYRIDPNAKDFMNLAKKHYQDVLLAKEWMVLDEDQQTILIYRPRSRI
jgi:hypothetical protein